jgi:hypothetical protein
VQTKHSSFDRIVEINNNSLTLTPLKDESARANFFFEGGPKSADALEGKVYKGYVQYLLPGRCYTPHHGLSFSCGTLLDGTAGPYDDEARLCENGGPSATFKTRGLCWLGGGETCTRLIMGLRIGDWEIVAGATDRLQIPRIKEDGRAATWQSQQRAPCFCR